MVSQKYSLFRPLRLASYPPLFLSPVYTDGRVCISILHTPGEDPLGYESPAERWSPVQSIEKILLSVISMLAGKTYLASFPVLHALVWELEQE